MNPLKDKHVVLGVTGSIAAYKAADLASKLVQAGAKVDVVLSENASRFVAPITFQGLTHRPVVTDLFDPQSELYIDHVALALRADVIIVAPATANVLAKLAAGMADDPLTATVLGSTAPLVVAPAMDVHMFDHPAVQENLARLRARNVTIIGPELGRLASGLMGTGRLVEPEVLVEHLRMLLGKNGDLKGKKVVVSAGGTQEPLDPVRMLTNRSSGKQGYAVAQAARDRGAAVTLVTAPTSLRDPVGVRVVRVTTALEMRDAMLAASEHAHIVIMAAAVADYRPTNAAQHKLKKTPDQTSSLELVKNPDIIAEVQGPFIKVGFAAETQDLIPNASAKLRAKGLHLIAANDVTATDAGFGTDTNRVVLIDRNGTVDQLPSLSKYEVGHRILDRVLAIAAMERHAG
ncbi:MAG: bifunctional phosphopantothenoylcysteine decarboxylase/phosphopantothenate--cysteine ligase CoaBC [Dehalococcoidia bacterium]|nr:bifunctional phosphopantothenoylcysteine decarboxylase/phosphopantothenate--cysteine ligase CoaBC [Dehalococcoidia bacterium]